MNGEVQTPGTDGARVAGAAVFLTVFGTTFACLALLPVDVPVYVPLEHRWTLGFPPRPAIGMDYFGRAFASLVLGFAAGAASWALCRFALRWDPEKNPGAVKALSLYSFLAVGFSLFVYAYTLLFR